MWENRQRRKSWGYCIFAGGKGMRPASEDVGVFASGPLNLMPAKIPYLRWRCGDVDHKRRYLHLRWRRP
uniref:OJ1005_B10.21 protein n=1 Tax=Oryza sativa subsp. japonica TaxID=39947 RepID=Q7EZN5_ORYSJ|nr:OJ1005_B10.21 [Oryza sativa Japonica Group]